MIDSFIKGLKLIVPRFIDFFKKFFSTMWFYSYFSFIIIAIVGIIAICLHWLDIDTDTAIIIIQVLFTVCQIIPLSLSLDLAQNSDKEFSSDLCFVACGTYIAVVWLII